MKSLAQNDQLRTAITEMDALLTAARDNVMAQINRRTDFMHDTVGYTYTTVQRLDENTEQLTETTSRIEEVSLATHMGIIGLTERVNTMSLSNEGIQSKLMALTL